MTVFLNRLRADVVVERTTTRKCGYLIQPKVWFTSLSKSITEMLEDIGLPVQKSYTGEGEISVVLNAVRGWEELSPCPLGIEMVRLVNGRIKSPKNHDEVEDILAFLDEEARLLMG